jgi:hypothetical protein
MFRTNLSKFRAFYDIPNFNLVLLTIFLREIFLFFTFQDLAFFETAYGQIWLFKFFWTWQPCVCATKKRERMAHLPPLLTCIVVVVAVKTAERTVLIK